MPISGILKNSHLKNLVGWRTGEMRAKVTKNVGWGTIA